MEKLSEAVACPEEPGVLKPLVDRNRCEAKADCVDVCPYNVFVIGRISDEEFADLSFIGRLRSRAHRRQTAYTPNAGACRACGLCVTACPERAIRLVRADRPARNIETPGSIS